MEITEKRKSVRYLSNLKARYVYVRGMVSLEQETNLIDISINGIRLYLPSAIKRGDIFLVELRLPDIITAIAKVVWTKQEGNEEEAGAIFDWVSNKDMLSIYVNRLSTTSSTA